MQKLALRLLPLALILLASAATAQRKELNVQIVDMNGAEVGPVSLTFTSPEGEVVEAATKKNGKLRIRLTASEEPWKVVLRMEGYPDQEHELLLNEGGPDRSFAATLYDEETMVKQNAIDNFNDGIRLFDLEADTDCQHNIADKGAERIALAQERILADAGGHLPHYKRQGRTDALGRPQFAEA